MKEKKRRKKGKRSKKDMQKCDFMPLVFNFTFYLLFYSLSLTLFIFLAGLEIKH